MNKSDLKTGMLVQCRRNNWYVVQKDIVDADCDCYDVLIDFCSGQYLALDRINENLLHCECSSEFDIIKVATVNYIGDIFGRFGKNPEKIPGFKIIWQREIEKEQQLKEIISKMEDELKKILRHYQ